MLLRSSQLHRLTDPSSFVWATGIEDTFITAPWPKTGRILDEYELTGHYERWQADLGLMLMDRDPLVLDAVQQAIRATRLGPALVPAWSFVSITEVSEYVPTVEQYAERLQREGTRPSDPAYEAKLNAYR